MINIGIKIISLLDSQITDPPCTGLVCACAGRCLSAHALSVLILPVINQDGRTWEIVVEFSMLDFRFFIIYNGWWRYWWCWAWLSHHSWRDGGGQAVIHWLWGWFGGVTPVQDGIMNLNGKDYVFQRAMGNAEWWLQPRLIYPVKTMPVNLGLCYE